MTDLNNNQRKQLQSIADTLGDNLGYAWNYIGTLERLGFHANRDRTLFLHYSQFISTVVYATWDALFLKLNHCTDKNKKAYGFPRLFKTIIRYLPEEAELMNQITEDEQRILKFKSADKIKNWRHQMVAHHTHDGHSFRGFYEENQCDVEEVRLLVKDYQDILNRYTSELLYLEFRPDDMACRASNAVDVVIEGLKK